MNKNKILISSAGLFLLCGSNANAGNFVSNSSGECDIFGSSTRQHIAVPAPGGGFICQDDYVNNATGAPGADGLVDVSEENREFAAANGVEGVDGGILPPDDDLLAMTGLVAQTRQITRRITNTIAQRLSSNMVDAFAENTTENKISGSSDSTNQNVGFWGGTNFSQITEDDGEAVHIDNDIYQFTGGFDKAVGNLFFGAALTYAYAENEQVGLDGNSNTVGITPYIAYKLTDFMFASALAGYNYTGVMADGPDTDIHEYYTEANLNVFKEINSFILKGRAGIRYNHSFASIKTGLDNSSDEIVWIGDAEIGYRFNNGVKAYTGVLYEHYDREASGNTSTYHDGVFYMRWGADYSLTEKLTIGANIETDLSDKDTSLIGGGVNIRLEM